MNTENKRAAAPSPVEQDERITELEAENDQMRDALADKVSAATMLRDISIRDGGVNMQFEGGASQLLAGAFADQFREKGGANYLEIGFTTPDGLNLLVTLQNVDGKTPGKLKAEADARIAELEAQLADTPAQDKQDTADDLPTYVIVHRPGLVPDRKGGFHDKKHVENMLRELYEIYPDCVCDVITMPSDCYPESGRTWIDMYGDKRRKPLPEYKSTPLPAGSQDKQDAVDAARPGSSAVNAARDVLAERRRQVEKEGYDAKHDDEHQNEEIAAYAAFYAMPQAVRDWPATETGYGDDWANAIVPHGWPVPPDGDRRRELVKAGALILAEIERIDRAAMQAQGAKK